MASNRLVSEWLQTYRSKNTKRNYRGALRSFFEHIFGESSLDGLDEQAQEYFSQERDYERDIIGFVSSINHQAPLTVRVKVTGARLFFMEQDIEFKRRFWMKTMRQVKDNRAATLDRTPTKKELRQILSHMRTKGRALFLTLVSSGMRIGETLQLTLDDIELAEDLVKIRLRGEYTKSGDSRYCFASIEAREAITEWLKIRQQYLRQAAGRSHTYVKDVEDNRVFPFTSSIAYYIWTRTLDKAELNGKDKSTGRLKLHPHSLRKFFRNKMAGLSGNVDFVEALMGHTNYLTLVYRRYSEKELEQFYRESMAAVLIFMKQEQVENRVKT